MDEWYYQRGGATFGPISASQLLALRERGSLQDDTKLRRGLAADWIELKDAPLADAVNHPPPLPAQPMAATRLPVSTRPGTRRLVPGGPSGWLWFFGVAAVLITGAHSLVLMMNALSFALALLPPLELPYPMILFVNFCAEALVFSSVLYFASIIIWQGAAFASLACVYGENNLPHGSGSGFWWLAPFANFVVPFRCLRVMRHLSRRLRDVTASEPSSSLSVTAIQVAFIMATVFRVLEKVASSSTGFSGVASESANPFLAMMLDLSLAAFALQIAIFILINLIQQVRLFRDAGHESEIHSAAP